MLVNKVIVEDTKLTKHKRKEQERAQGKAKRETGLPNVVSHPKTHKRPNKPPRVEASVASSEVKRYVYCRRRYSGNYWWKFGACL